MTLCLPHFACVVFEPVPSPYPASRISKSSVTTNTSKDTLVENTSKSTPAIPVFRELPVSSNHAVAPMLNVLTLFSQLVLDTINTVKDEKKASNNRPRVASTA